MEGRRNDWFRGRTQEGLCVEEESKGESEIVAERRREQKPSSRHSRDSSCSG